MSYLGYGIAAIFLPLFPFSLLFNQLLQRLGDPRRRMTLLLLWPLPGLLMLIALGGRPPAWALWWAVATAVLYALRAVTLRDLGLWTGFMATSAWSLLWPVVAVAPPDTGAFVLLLQAVGLSAPLILLAWLGGQLETLLGAAYAGLRGGLGETLPRLSGLLVIAILAAVASPLVPGFFTLLSTTANALALMPGVAVLILTVWLLWAWGGARMLRGFVIGPAHADPLPDLERATTLWLGLAAALLVLAGIGLSGELT